MTTPEEEHELFMVQMIPIAWYLKSILLKLNLGDIDRALQRMRDRFEAREQTWTIPNRPPPGAPISESASDRRRRIIIRYAAVSERIRHSVEPLWRSKASCRWGLYDRGSAFFLR